MNKLVRVFLIGILLTRPSLADEERLHVLLATIGRQTLFRMMGAIPAKYSSQSTWEYHYGGDGNYYEHLKDVISKILWVDKVIYQIRPP